VLPQAKKPQVCALITIAMQLTCVVDKEILCTDNETLAQFLNVPTCNAFRGDPRSFIAFPRDPAAWRYSARSFAPCFDLLPKSQHELAPQGIF
jgi:hypothetical protein